MSHRFQLALAAMTVFSFASQIAAADYTVKPRTNPVPKELSKPIAELLGDRSVQLFDASGGVVAELWFRKDTPAKATAEQVKNGLTLHEIDESTILGAIRLEQPGSDYRQQKIQPGVYTIRLGFQPMDGDHMGTAPYPDFGLLVPAKADAKPDTMSAKDLQDLSKKASGSSHPAVFLIYPNDKPEDVVKLVDKGNGIWVLNTKLPITAANQKTAIGIGLTLIGHSEG